MRGMSTPHPVGNGHDSPYPERLRGCSTIDREGCPRLVPTPSITPADNVEMRRTLGCGGQVLQKRATVRVHSLALFLHLLLNLYRTNDERIDPTPNHLLVSLAPVLEKLKEWPEVPHQISPEDQRLDIYKRLRKRVEPIIAEREGVKVLPEEELGCRVDRESREEVFEVERVLGVGAGHNADHFLGVPLE